MTRYANDFEGQTEGVTVSSATSTASGDDIGAVAIGAGSTFVYSAAAAINGSRGLKLNVTSGTPQTYYQRTLAAADRYCQIIGFRFVTLPTSQHGFASLRTAAAQAMTLSMGTDGALKIGSRVANPVTGGTTTTLCAPNTKYFGEMACAPGASTNTGVWTFKLYDENGTVLETLSGTGQDMGSAQIAAGRVGRYTANASLGELHLDYDIMDGLATGFIGAPVPTTRTLFGTAPISVGSSGDFSAVNCGIEFYPNSPTWVTKIRYMHADYAGVDLTPRTCGIYTVGGTLVSGPFTMPTPVRGQWCEYTLPTPLSLAVGTKYRVVIHHPAGEYAATGGYFVSGGLGANNTVIGSVTLPSKANSTGGLQGAYGYSAVLAPPTDEFNGGNYYSDITFTDVNPNSGVTATSEFDYYAQRSGLPASASLADHRYAYLLAKTGLDNKKSISDLENVLYAGNEWAYWANIFGAGAGTKSLSDLREAVYLIPGAF